MADTTQGGSSVQEPLDKGKGKANEATGADMNMETEEDSSSEEELDEDAPVADEEDADNMEEIDTGNIISDGRRTRGRKIDFAKAAEDFPEDDDEDEDEDDDFEAADDDDKMEEFGSSSLHQRDPRSALFENYNPGSAERSRTASTSPKPPGGGYGYAVGGGEMPSHGYRTATPNSRGQYSDAVLNELESQNDGQVEGIMGKVRQLKDMTIAIGDEIRDSSALAEKMNDSFDNTRIRLRGTMNRMLLMAERTGVGWKVWVAFFLAVILLFFYVWVF